MPSNMEIRRISATLSPSTGVRETPKVAKLIDTTTCIGCKACEVACQEWNDLQSEETQQFGTYQDRKSTRLNSSHIQKSRMPSSA